MQQDKTHQNYLPWCLFSFAPVMLGCPEANQLLCVRGCRSGRVPGILYIIYWSSQHNQRLDFAHWRAPASVWATGFTGVVETCPPEELLPSTREVLPSHWFQQQLPGSMCRVLCFSTHQDPADSSQESKIIARGIKGRGNHKWKLVPWFQGLPYGCQKCEGATHHCKGLQFILPSSERRLRHWGPSLPRGPQYSRSSLRLSGSLTKNQTLICYKPKFVINPFWPRGCWTLFVCCLPLLDEDSVLGL